MEIIITIIIIIFAILVENISRFSASTVFKGKN